MPAWQIKAAWRESKVITVYQHGTETPANSFSRVAEKHAETEQSVPQSNPGDLET
jgi:hypothetical protein